MGENGGMVEIKKSALTSLAREIGEARVPAVLSSYMTAENLPDNYKGIDEYVKSVRDKLIREAGGSLTQLQMIVLDGICEMLIVVKYISTYIGENPGGGIVSHDKYGIPHPSELVVRGFSNLHQVLDKKIKQFHEMTAGQKDELSPAEIHRRAIMGEYKPAGKPPTGRPTGGQKHNSRDGETGRFLKSSN